MIRFWARKSRGEISEGEDRGILLSSGFVAGEALMGILIAVLIYFDKTPKWDIFSKSVSEVLSLFVLFALAYFLYRTSKKSLSSC